MSNGVQRRGIEAMIGAPSQPMALAINADWNNTIIFDTNTACYNLTVVQCGFKRGGLFDSSISGTWESPPIPSAAEFRPADKGALGVIAFGADQIFLSNTTGNLTRFTFFKPSPDMQPPSFPFGLHQDTFFPKGILRPRKKPVSEELSQSCLGLGRNSTILESLSRAGKIASQTWSLFWGLEGNDTVHDMVGSLTLGGYNRAKTTGPNLTQAFGSLQDMNLCPSSLIVPITEIRVRHPNGSATSIFAQATGTALRACIKPDIPLMSLPRDIFQTFTEAIGGTYLGPGGTHNGQSSSYKPWGLEYETQGVFGGDLQVVLGSGLELTIPNHQLVVPDIQITTDGRTHIPTDSVREVLVNNLESSNLVVMPELGQVFLTSAYMHVDNEREQFSLWQANSNTTEELVAVEGRSPSTCIPASPPSEESQAEPSTRRLSAPAIAGVTVGGAFFCLVFVTGFLFLYMRLSPKRREGRKKAGRKPSLHDTYKETALAGDAVRRPWHIWPRPGSGRGPPELEGNPVHELHSGIVSPLHELDTNNSVRRADSGS